MTTRDMVTHGELAAAISTAVVHTLAETTGKGPTKAKTTLGENGVFVVLQDNLTTGERTLVAAGEGPAVLDMRKRWQNIMRTEMSEEMHEAALLAFSLTFGRTRKTEEVVKLLDSARAAEAGSKAG